MKKATLKTLVDYIVDNGVDELSEVKDELLAELNKGEAEKAAKAAAYEGIHDVIVDNLTDTPMSCADLWVEIEGEVTAKGMTRHNVQYALNNLWQDEIVKIPGKPNNYRKA